jgi:hypothetical protein
VADADLRQRSPWRVLLPVLIFAALVAVATLLRLSTGDPASGAIVLRGGIGLLALWALVDGARRGFGVATFLGTGRGLDRIFGFVQVALSVGVAIALLPNTFAFIELVARFVTGNL